MAGLGHKIEGHHTWRCSLPKPKDGGEYIAWVARETCRRGRAHHFPGIFPGYLMCVWKIATGGWLRLHPSSQSPPEELRSHDLALFGELWALACCLELGIPKGVVQYRQRGMVLSAGAAIVRSTRAHPTQGALLKKKKKKKKKKKLTVPPEVGKLDLASPPVPEHEPVFFFLFSL